LLAQKKDDQKNGGSDERCSALPNLSSCNCRRTVRAKSPAASRRLNASTSNGPHGRAAEAGALAVGRAGMRWEAGAASAMHASVREGRQKRRACRERTSTCPATEGISCHLYPEPH